MKMIVFRLRSNDHRQANLSHYIYWPFFPTECSWNLGGSCYLIIGMKVKALILQSVLTHCISTEVDAAASKVLFSYSKLTRNFKTIHISSGGDGQSLPGHFDKMAGSCKYFEAVSDSHQFFI